MNITKEAWKEILAILYKHHVPYTTNVVGNTDKHIKIDFTIPNYYEDRIIK